MVRSEKSRAERQRRRRDRLQIRRRRGQRARCGDCNIQWGGTGYFTTLHILDVAAARAFDDEGKLTWQVNLTLLPSVALGDRWDGEVRIANNAIRVVTTRSGPADESGARRTKTIPAERP